jgi:hypothetical protein
MLNVMRLMYTHNLSPLRVAPLVVVVLVASSYMDEEQDQDDVGERLDRIRASKAVALESDESGEMMLMMMTC